MAQPTNTTAQKFRKKPVEITAFQLTATNVRDVQDWCGAVNGAGVTSPVQVQWHFGDGATAPEDRVGWLVLTTIHGEEAIARPGDWVIPEPKSGCFYPCNGDVFAATYEPVQA